MTFAYSGRYACSYENIAYLLNPLMSELIYAHGKRSGFACYKPFSLNKHRRLTFSLQNIRFY